MGNPQGSATKSAVEFLARFRTLATENDNGAYAELDAATEANCKPHMWLDHSDW